ncbi:hypothetical protein TNCV_3581371 [Trichonephila clavipes]|nr:hypothetical protein TNCV_3581371 [Trichonephila clavipes]
MFTAFFYEKVHPKSVHSSHCIADSDNPSFKSLRCSSPVILKVRLPPQPLSSVFEENKMNMKVISMIEGDREGPVCLLADPLNFLGGPLSRHHSSLIDKRSKCSHGSPHFSPTHLVLDDNRPAL